MTRFPKVTSFILAIFVLVSSSCLNDSTKHGVDAAAFSPNSVKGRKHPSHQGKNHRSFAAPHLVAQSSQFYPRGHYDPIAFRKPSSLLANSADDNKEDDAKVSSNKAELILEQIHSKSFRYRIVVIGNGAILETTSILGPHYASNVSPKTGDRIITLASEDKSFEFHVKVDQVSKVTFSEVEKPVPPTSEDQPPTTKTMRIIRFVNTEGGPMCSLILQESDEAAIEWFTGMMDQYGPMLEL